MNLDIDPHIRHSTRHIGRSVPRREDRGPLTGRGRYVADIKIAGMLEVAFVRSTEAHARITSIDTSEALEIDGVVAVFTAADLTDVNTFPDYIEYIGPVRQRPLADDRVRYVGAPYAAVVAVDRYVAEDGATLVAAATVYEPLPTVSDLDQAIADGAPKLYDHWDDNFSFDVAPHKPEVDRAFEEADHIFTETSSTPPLWRGRYTGASPRGSRARCTSTSNTTPTPPIRYSRRSWTTWSPRARRCPTWRSTTSSRPRQNSPWGSRAAAREARSDRPQSWPGPSPTPSRNGAST